MRKIILSYVIIPLLAFAAFHGARKGVVTAGDLIDARKSTK